MKVKESGNSRAIVKLPVKYREVAILLIEELAHHDPERLSDLTTVKSASPARLRLADGASWLACTP